MDKEMMHEFIGNEDISLIEALKKIDANANRILFLSREGALVGCLSDGDIRRYLLGGGDLEGPAIAAANRSPKVANTEEEAKALYDKKHLTAIPIVDDQNRILDIYIEARPRTASHDALDIPVVINAGGKGTRLKPFTNVLPKPLIPVGELPIIEHIMREFETYHCDDFHIIVNHKRELMKGYFSGLERSYHITWYDEEQPLGTGGGLRLLKDKLDSTFFFTNCDNLLWADFGEILRFHRDNQNVITMVCAYKNYEIPYGVVEMGENGKILSMKEKPGMTYLTNTGIYVVEPEIIDDIEPDVSVGFPDIVALQEAKGKKVAAFPVGENEWMDMGQPEELEKMRRRLYGDRYED